MANPVTPDTPGRLTREQRADAVKVLTLLGSPCPKNASGDDHDWHECPRCEMLHELEQRGSLARRLLLAAGAALAAEGETPPALGWQPMATARRDGTVMLVIDHRGEPRVKALRFDPQHQRWVYPTDGHAGVLEGWRPLPAPVAGEGETPAVLPGLSGAMVDTGPGWTSAPTPIDGQCAYCGEMHGHGAWCRP